MIEITRDIRQVESYTVIFQPGNVKVADVPAGETLLRAASRAELFLTSPCGGAGSCGKCLTRVTRGHILADPHPSISQLDWESGIRLACTSRIIGDVEVEIPVSSGLWAAGSVGERRLEGRSRGRLLDVAEWRLPRDLASDPPVKRLAVRLTPPTSDDRTSDGSRLEAALRSQLQLGAVAVPLDVLRALPRMLRDGDWTLTATLRETGCGWEVVRITLGSDAAPAVVAAIDVGTTTIWGELLDCGSGAVLGSSATYNRQIQFGEDVISRMVRAQEPGGQARLQQAVMTSIAEVLTDAEAQSGIPGDRVEQVTVAGNTTMICLLLGIDTRYLRLEPYVPPLDRLSAVAVDELGGTLPMAFGAKLESLPSVASYVGGDVVAGVLASGMADRDEVGLYLDIGTNGEAVIGNREWLLAASCSAGPAFEGGGLRHGMRATSGAIEAFSLDPHSLGAAILTIGDLPPAGICGSGVIDAVSELLRAGILLPNGRFDLSVSAPGLRLLDGRGEYVIAEARYTASGEDIVLTEADVDNVVRAKGAMFAGVTTLLKTLSLDWADLDRVYVAGGFGRHLRVEQAMSIGLFPEIEVDRFVFVGNGSLLGARMVALSRAMGAKAAVIAATVNNIELSNSLLFQEEYVAALFLPHTDMSRFPEMERVLARSKGSR